MLIPRDIFDKLKKIKALVDNGGTDGEKAAAATRFEAVLKRACYSISDYEQSVEYYEVDSPRFYRSAPPRPKYYEIRYHGRMGKALLIAIIANMKGVTAPFCKKNYCTFDRKGYLGVNLMPGQLSEIIIKYDDMRKEMMAAVNRAKNAAFKMYVASV